MKSHLVALFAITALTLSAETPLWLRDVAISPDGSTVAFTYKGDIFSVPATGGKATRLTSTPAVEQTPVWSPDGTKIAFASDRSGGKFIYVMDATGGNATRLTFNSAAATPLAFSPDGKAVLFSASIQDPAESVIFPTSRMPEVYSVPVEGGRMTQVLATPAEMISWLPDGTKFLYHDNKGMENEWRKHHTSSVTRDIWLYDTASKRHTNLTNRAGEDRNPVVSPDGKTVYFLSERNGGAFNVYSFPLDNPSAVSSLTNFSDHPVRFLSAANNGLMAFAWDGEIYTLKPGSQPAKLNIDIVMDNDLSPTPMKVASGEKHVVSPDGKQLAFVNRGDVFVASVDHGSIRQITSTAATEDAPSWGKDGRTLYYTSERDGRKNIWKASIAQSSDPNFSNATMILEEAVFSPAEGIDRERPIVSPDGKKMLFVEDRNKVKMLDLASKKVTDVAPATNYPQRDGDFSLEWAPDSRWIAAEVMARRHDPYADICLIDTQTGETINLTNSGYFDIRPHFVMNGDAVLFLSERFGMRNHASWGSMFDVMLAFLNEEAYDRYRLNEEDYELYKDAEKANKKADEPKDDKKDKKDKKSKKKDDDKAKTDDKAKELKIDRRGIEDRVVRLTPNSSDIADAILTDDGETLYYLSEFEKGYDLWKKALRKGETAIVKKLDAKESRFQMLPDGSSIFILGSKVKKMNPTSGGLTDVSFSGSRILDEAAEREAMFNYVKNEERERFYVTDMHGVDWENLTEHYRKFLPHINNNHDFSELLSELLGELNVSHTGSGFRSKGADEPTASLGLIYDLNREGDGLMVTEVVAGGPFDKAKTEMTAGSVITAINGLPLKASEDWTKLLNNQTKKKTLVTFTTPGGKTVAETVLPISASRFSDLLYNRWVKGREAYVDSISGHRLGYVHIKSMSDDSFRKVYSDVLGRFNDREAIVIDTRWNSGGRLHEDIEALFSGTKYLTQTVRDTPSCDMPSRRWNKPSIMVVCEANYSNAHGTPWVYMNRKIGKTVGAPVPGTMTSVNWVTLQDPSMYFGIPVVGYMTDGGYYLENHQLNPDILVLNNPETVVRGEDLQLKTAVETLLNDLK